jgi:UDP-N-acetylglucosamine--N-acetylmuramyl-(pentapeptide) pyrophosphoryl-undecaprenol N-acetylglucosamine transferase
MRAVLAGGGTGGHVIPALAIAHELRSLFSAELLFIGTSRGIENRLVPAAGFQLRLVEVGALKKVSVAKRVATLTSLPRAVFCSWQILGQFRPDVVIGVGGYASGPAMMAAALSGMPTLAFEPNVVPGLANRIMAPIVSAAAVHFQETCRYFARCLITGVPVRREFFNLPPKLPGSPPTLLVFGGSQGAHAINEVVTTSLPALIEQVPRIHLIHQTGERDYNDAQAIYLQLRASAEVFPFIEEMSEMFARADLLICRSGASTVAEVTAAGKPAIFVPFPHATDDHQMRNAQALERAGAAVVFAEKDLTSERLVSRVRELLCSPERLARMAAASIQLSHPNATREIALMAGRLAGVPA